MIDYYVTQNHQDELKILCSVPGVAYTAASTLISEIGDINDFSSAKKLVAWTGIAPSVHQSAGTLRMGSITKKGNRTLRWIAVEIAHVCARMKGTRLWDFFERIKKRSGYKKAIVALARKILTIIWHLLVNKETYDKKQSTIPKFLKMASNIGIDEALGLIQNAKKEVTIQYKRGSLLDSKDGT